MVRFDPKACSACQACAVACIDENDLPRGRGKVCAWRSVTETEKKTGQRWTFSRKMHGCMHCAKARCMEVCPVGCFTRERGLVLANKEACIGCGKCAQACPFDAIRFDADGRIEKCDGCIDRVRHGLRPACEQICPPQALRFILE